MVLIVFVIMVDWIGCHVSTHYWIGCHILTHLQFECMFHERNINGCCIWDWYYETDILAWTGKLLFFWVGYYVEVTCVCLTYWNSRVILPIHLCLCTDTALSISLLSTGHLPTVTNRPRLEGQWSSLQI